MFPCKGKGTDDGVQGRAHVMRHAAEKGFSRFFVFSCGVESLFQKLFLFKLLPFFHFDISEAQDDLVVQHRFVVQNANVRPAEFVIVKPQEIAAEVMHMAPDKLLDIPEGETFRKFPAGVFLQRLFQHLHQTAPCERRALDHLVGSILIVHPVQAVIDVSQNLKGFTGADIPPVRAVAVPCRKYDIGKKKDEA